MIDVVALGELLIDFAAKSTDAAGYPTMAANPGGAPGNFLAALNAYGRKIKLLKDDEKVSGEDCREGLTCVISVKLTDKQKELFREIQSLN